ncbi:hypothetical protein BSQ98_18255 [Serratia liquefaciens]|uniref:sce7726 family protein n=1 Tax=Serratia liquefaciens TaxID=614 RepID=UPI00101EDC9A|nr:sce7726 family protein [Serratia liquefaciens]RYM61530.1 hypothetical protein BSQ98_18255 [Serratia liquefaciens]
MKKPLEIRNQLRSWIREESNYYSYDASDVLIDELCFFDRKARADLVYANGKLTAFEIKSYADSLTRWSFQHDAYLRVFDVVWLCCHYKHAMKAMSMSSDKVGIILVDDTKNGMAILREAKKNNKVNPEDMLAMLWRSELDELCKENNISVLRKERIKEAQKRVSLELHLDIIREKVLHCLKERYRGKDY